MLHRYQVEAAAKSLGGVVSASALAGDSVQVTMVPAAQQAKALDALMAALSAEALTVPARLVPLLSYGEGDDGDYQTRIEIMPTAGGPAFDGLRATEIGAVQVLDSLLEPQRLNRLEQQNAADPAVPSPHAVVARLLAHADALAGQGAAGRRIATTIALDLARTAREKALGRAIGLTIDGQLAGWARSLAASTAAGAQGDWRRGLGALLADKEALARRDRRQGAVARSATGNADLVARS